MRAKQEARIPWPASVDLVVKPHTLEGLDLPRPRLSPFGEQLIAEVGEHKFILGIVALPPERGKLGTKLQKLMRRKAKSLGIKPPVPFEEFTRTEHAPSTVSVPYVFMKDGQRFGISIAVPNALVDSWSEERRRHPKTNLGYSVDLDHEEIYQVQQTVGVVVRVNGKPLEVKYTGEVSAKETFTGFSLGGETESQEYDFALLTKRRIAGMPNEGEETHPTDEDTLKFGVTGVVGEESNADFDTRAGLIQVIFVRYDTGVEQVVGMDESWHGKMKRENAERRRRMGIPDDRDTVVSELFEQTVQGEVRFGKPRRVETKITKVSNIVPLAEITLALAGRGESV